MTSQGRSENSDQSGPPHPMLPNADPSEYMIVFTSFTRASFLNMQADQSSSWLIRTSFPESTIKRPFCKMSKNGNTSPFFKILFFKNIWIYLRLIFFRTVQIKDSCIVDIKNRKFHLLFLRLI